MEDAKRWPRKVESGQTGSVSNLDKAMLAVMGDIADPLKTGDNPHFKSKFAPLDEVIGMIRPLITGNGILFLQEVVGGGADTISVKSTLIHAESSEERWSISDWIVPRRDPQGQGTALSYARRYTMKGWFMLAEVDDDGERARQAVPKERSGDAKEKKADDITGLFARGLVMSKNLARKKIEAYIGGPLVDADEAQLEKLRGAKAQMEDGQNPFDQPPPEAPLEGALPENLAKGQDPVMDEARSAQEKIDARRGN